MKLVIVESPTKCTTIKRYLGEDYEVMASLGHIRDLATSGRGGLGVDVENGFLPTYIINKDKINVVNQLKEATSKADEVILATDPDREGEAIAWHLAKVLNLDINTTKRLEFHEITRVSIAEAMKSPRTIDLNLVESQETRRIVDRIIGFKLSTLLYKKMHSRSAGRVQSATLKIINDHELEIAQFVPEEYWNILCAVKLGNHDINLDLVDYLGKGKEVKTESEAQDILNHIPETIKIVSVKRDIRVKESKEPFTTSTLQQEAFAKLKFKTSKTQLIAQKLYEGINVGGEHMGLITYMRTDSTRLSPTFVERATNFIRETFGEEYLGHQKKLRQVSLMQDAHEAIRPSSNHRTPESVKQYLTNEQYQLYRLIYNRTIASLMKPKKEEVLVVTLEANGVTFKCEFARTVFKGYEIVLGKDDEENNAYSYLPDVNEGDELVVIKKEKEQKFTQAPAHYSEAKVVKLMEEVGIGRPSTYASTIDTLRSRKYVDNAGGIMTITEQGGRTAHVLEKYFPEIVNAKYTAKMEQKLDNVQEGSDSRLKVLSDFYYPFIKEIEKANEIMYKDDDQPTGKMCPVCGSELVYKQGKNGIFIGCSNYPTCKYIEKEPKKELKYTGENCPICGKPLVEREKVKGKTKSTFIACSGYPTCTYIKQDVKPAPKYSEKDYVKKCPDCDGFLVKKKKGYQTFLGCTNFPKCRHMEKIVRKRSK
ncbi:MAG: type I DNA topoisomerase [Bacilli bacterium]|nr:type I DNA topoisomerase [Bacilli bacterium]